MLASTWMTRWVTRSTVVATGATDTLTGSRRSSSARPAISRGIVAEKKRFWRRDRKVRDDAPDRLLEAEVEHLVGFVEHEDLGAVEHRIALAHVVEQPPRRGNQDVDAAGECLDLRADGRRRRTRRRHETRRWRP